MSTKGQPPPERNRKELALKLDLLERKIEELRILYEQYFIDVQPLPPDKLHKETTRLIRTLLRAPFKNSQTRFRMRNLVTRFQTYNTYWERINKAREDGTYSRDLFRAEMREKMLEDARREVTEAGMAEKGLKQLFSSYEKALGKAGGQAANLDYNAFKKKMMAQAKALKEKHGIKKLSYKVVMKGGKAVIKASAKRPRIRPLKEELHKYQEAEENEPYLGPWWTVLMLVLLGIKQLFPTEPYTLYWFIESYIILLLMGVTAFALFKRWRFYQRLKERKKETAQNE